MKSDMIDKLVYWVEERDRVRIRKEVSHPKPWSADHIFQSVRFCNVRREDDKVTKWIAKYWRNPHADDNTLPFGMVLARVVNLPSTLAHLGYPDRWNSAQFVDDMDELQAAGPGPIWTNAYMVTGGYSKGGETKQQIMARVLDKAWLNCQDVIRGRTIQLSQIADVLQRTPGLGTFLAAQVVADLKQVGWYKNLPDWWTWCAPGPGSTMGLNYLYGRDPGKSLSEKQFRDEVNRTRVMIGRYTDFELCAHDTQNCLCEFSKYMRVLNGGRAKRSYNGR